MCQSCLSDRDHCVVRSLQNIRRGSSWHEGSPGHFYGLCIACERKLQKETYSLQMLRTFQKMKPQKHKSDDSTTKKFSYQKMEIIFSLRCTGGSINLARGGRDVRTSDQFLQDPETGEEYCSDLKGETDGSDPAKQQKGLVDLEARRDLWSTSGEFLIIVTTFKRGNIRCATGMLFPTPTSVHWCREATEYCIGRMARQSNL